MPLLQVGEVARVGDVAPRGGQDEVGMAPEFRQPRGQPLDLRGAGQHVQQPREHVDRAGGVLADHVEHRVAQAVVVRHRVDEYDAPLARDGSGRQVARRNPTQRVAQVVQHAARRHRVVDAGRKRSHRDLDELPHRVFQVLKRRGAPPEGERPGDRLGSVLDPRGEEGDRESPRHEVARPDPQGEDDAMLVRPVGKAIRVDRLQVAAVRRRDRAAAWGVRWWLDVGLVTGPCLDCRAEIAVDGVDHGLDVDAGGDVVDEPDQRPERDQREQHGTRDGEVRDEGLLLDGAHRAQHHQRVGEGAEEDAEHELIAGVAHEVAQQPRPHLVRGERQRRDGDGEGGAGHPDGGGGHRAEQRPCPLGAPGPAPVRVRGGRIVAGDVRGLQPDGRLRQADAGEYD